MTIEQNKAAIRNVFAALDARDVETVARDFMAPNYKLQFDSMPPMDKAGATQFFRAFLAGFPDLTHRIEAILAEGDRVGCRLIVRGTHQQEFMGIPPTNKSIEVAAINIFRLKDGKVVDHRVISDGIGMLRQLGVIPGPDQQRGGK